MRPFAILLLGWLVVSAGTLFLLLALGGRAFLAGGGPAYGKLGIKTRELVLILLLVSLCWPWAWSLLRRTARGNP